MRRHLGRIERAILASIAASKRVAINRSRTHRSVIEVAAAAGSVQGFDISRMDDDSAVHITARTLAYECFGRPHEWDWTPSHSQIKVCNRAIQSIARKFPQYGIIPGRGSKGIVLYEIADPVSVVRAKMRMGIENPVSRSVVAATFEGQKEDHASRLDATGYPGGSSGARRRLLQQTLVW